MVNIIWLVLVLFALLYIYVFAVDIIKNKNKLENVSWIKTGLIGFVVNFFDVLGIGAFAFVLIHSPARMARITAFLNPDKWTDSINYQPTQSLIALGSGQIWGKGLGQGISKYGHLPEDTTDFIFSIGIIINFN